MRYIHVAFFFQVLNVPEAKVVRFFDPKLEVQNKENNGGDEIEQSVQTQGVAEPMEDEVSALRVKG